MTDQRHPVSTSMDAGRLPQLPSVLSPADLGVITDVMDPLAATLDISEKLPGLVLTEPTVLLLDINNLYSRARDNDWRIDYARLKSIFEQRCDLRHCAAFSAVDRQQVGSGKWVDYMTARGYEVVTKDLKRYTNHKGDLVSKGNMDIEITIAAMTLSEAFSHVIIGSCDGDFVPLVEKLKEGHYRKVSVLGMTNANWTGMSNTLIDAADNFYDMTAIKEHIEYVGNPNVR